MEAEDYEPGPGPVIWEAGPAPELELDGQTWKPGSGKDRGEVRRKGKKK